MKKSQTEQVLELLQRGPITPLEVFKKVGSLCAAERVRDLRERGFNILTKRLELPNGKTVAQYQLLKSRKSK
jgi:hypothetical protein